MSIEGTAQTEYASLSGKIQTFVVDKTLSISGACADAKATGEAIDRLDSVVEESKEAYDKAVEGMIEVAKQVITDIGAATTTTYTATATTDWLADDTNGGYLQMVELEGILATDNPIADIVMGDDVAANELYAKAWSCITRIVTDDDMVNLYANKEAPTTAFTMQLKVVR
jgi:hypothetical protein